MSSCSKSLKQKSWYFKECNFSLFDWLVVGLFLRHVILYNEIVKSAIVRMFYTAVEIKRQYLK